MAIVIVVSGPPGTGKSTLSARLGRDLRLPVIAKDAFKEVLYDNLGYSDQARSRELGGTAFELQYLVATKLVRSHVDFILEGAFHSLASSPIRKVLRGSDIIQVWIAADLEALVQRAKDRSRHPGHGKWGADSEEQLRRNISDGLFEPLEIGGELIKIETDCFESLDYEEKIHEIIARFA